MTKPYTCEGCSKRRQTKVVSSLLLSKSPALLCRECWLKFRAYEEQYEAEQAEFELRAVQEEEKLQRPPKDLPTPMIHPACEVKRRGSNPA